MVFHNVEPHSNGYLTPSAGEIKGGLGVVSPNLPVYHKAKQIYIAPKPCQGYKKE